jgi:hypothetical protein
VRALSESIAEAYPGQSDLKQLLERAASKGGRREILKQFVKQIRTITGDQEFGGQVEPERDQELLTRFERRLAEFMLRLLKVTSINELQSVASADVCRRVTSRGSGNVHEVLTLGECIEIVQREGNWGVIKAPFLSPTVGFHSKDEVEAALNQVTSYRNKLQHGRRLGYREDEIARLYLDKLTRCIDSFEQAD